MLRLSITLLLVLSLVGCSASNVTGTKETAEKPQTIVLPSTCDTSEVARFHRGEEILLVYDGEEPEKIKEDLRCMMLKGIGDGLRRYKVFKSNKPFGVSTFSMDTMIVTRYFMHPSRQIFSQETVTPSKNKEVFNAASFVFMATSRDVAIVLGAKGMFTLPAIGGGDSTITMQQFLYVLNTYLQSSTLPIKPPVTEKKIEEKDAKQIQ